eukprot:1563621-Pleurochrysis_carterae.AAC.2
MEALLLDRCTEVLRLVRTDAICLGRRSTLGHGTEWSITSENHLGKHDFNRLTAQSRAFAMTRRDII